MEECSDTEECEQSEGSDAMDREWKGGSDTEVCEQNESRKRANMLWSTSRHRECEQSESSDTGSMSRKSA